MECSIGIMVACCPALRVLIRRPDDIEMSRSSALRNLSFVKRGRESDISNWIEIHGKDDLSKNTPFRLVAAENGRYIIKNVDFEIASERASQSGRPINGRTESWE